MSQGVIEQAALVLESGDEMCVEVAPGSTSPPATLKLPGMSGSDCAQSRLQGVSTAAQPEDLNVTVYPPDEALRRARPLPLPPCEQLVVEGVSETEWAAFQGALAETMIGSGPTGVVAHIENRLRATI